MQNFRLLTGLCLGLSTGLLTACPGPDPAPLEAKWTVPVEAQGGALLSVLSLDGELWISGAADSEGGTLLHLADGAWSRETTGSDQDLWWVAAHPDGRLYMVGGGGTLLERSLDGNFTPLTVPTDMTLYGIWFNADGQGWAVGGDPLADGMTEPRGTMLRIDGSTVEVDAAAPAELSTHLMFKVWGRPGQSEEAYAIGDQGYLLRWDGTTWSESDSGTNARLITIAGDDSTRAIVGGTNQPTLLLDEGDGLIDRAAELPVGAQGLNGVFVRDGQLAAVGNLGYAAIRDEEGLWTSDYLGMGGLHAVSIDAQGEIWAVGGDLLGLDDGYVAHFGTSSVPTRP